MNLSYQKREQAEKEQRADWRRRWFGPPRAEVWSILAEELHAKFDAGKWYSGEKVTHQVDSWVLTLDIYLVSTGKAAVPYTRIRAPYLTADNFRFSITKTSFFSPLAKFFGAQDVLTGSTDFDDLFVVKTNQPERVKEFLSDAEFRSQLLANPEVALSVMDDEGYFGPKFGPNVDQLSAVVYGDIRDLDKLHGLFQLAADAMERLHTIGTAQPGKTGLEL